MNNTASIIEQTRKWIIDVVIGCNFCPFAAREMRLNSIHYEVLHSTSRSEILAGFLQECQRLDNEPSVETTLLILPEAVPDFLSYLDLLEEAERLLDKRGYEGVYQVASFHPLYVFDGSDEEDPANYTNRSPYPMLHLLREASIEAVLEKYNDPENIPERNIRFAREKGIEFMRKISGINR